LGISHNHMKMKIRNLLPFALIIALSSCANQDNSKSKNTSITVVEVNHENQELFNLIKEKDSLLFQIGFNQIDTLQVSGMTSSDFEFYHDEHGLTDTKSDFIRNINGIRE